MDLYTIGFTKKSAEQFFNLLEVNNIEKLIDIRRKPESQLSGFTKKRDLPFFLKKILNIEYIHMELLAPSQDILSEYRKSKDWSKFEKQFRQEISDNKVAYAIDRSMFEENNCVLLCSEHKPEKCHRRLVVEYLRQEWGSLNIHHLT